MFSSLYALQVSRNNAKSALSNLQFEFDKEKSENEKLTHELQVLQENLSELQMQCQCHLDDKRQLKAMLSETQKQVSEFEDKLNQTERALNEEKKLRQFEVSCLISFISKMFLSFAQGKNERGCFLGILDFVNDVRRYRRFLSSISLKIV